MTLSIPQSKCNTAAHLFVYKVQTCDVKVSGHGHWTLMNWVRVPRTLNLGTK